MRDAWAALVTACTLRLLHHCIGTSSSYVRDCACARPYRAQPLAVSKYTERQRAADCTCCSRCFRVPMVRTGSHLRAAQLVAVEMSA